jgi:hypothetical protein
LKLNALQGLPNEGRLRGHIRPLAHLDVEALTPQHWVHVQGHALPNLGLSGQISLPCGLTRPQRAGQGQAHALGIGQISRLKDQHWQTQTSHSRQQSR